MLTALLRHLRRDERGSAIINVVTILVISTIVVVGVSTSIFSANGVTTMSRAGVQSKAAAEAGIDWALGEFNRGNFPCASDTAQRTANPAFAVTISYTNAAGTTLSCATSVSGAPAKATIQSTGYAQLGGTRSTVANTHVMAATADITLATSGALLDRAVFTESSLNLTNNSVIGESTPGALDGDLYTNGSFTCATQNRIEGSVFARGDVTVTNICTAMESVWSGGNVDLQQSSVNLNGDVYAAGWVKVNVSHVAGNVVANGDVTTTDGNSKSCGSYNANVCGSIYSLNGAINLGSNGTPIGGSLYARGNVSQPSQNGLNPKFASVVSLNGALQLGGAQVAGTIKVYGNISSGNPGSNLVKANTCSATVTSSYWTTCPTSDLLLPMPSSPKATFTPAGSTNLGTRTSTVSVDLPPRQSFPQIFSSSSAIASNWSDWAKPTVPANMCNNASAFQNGLATLQASYSAGTKLLLVMPCTGVMYGDNVTLTLKGDVAVMTKYGVNWGNDTRVASSSGGPYSLMLIVPSDAPGITWSAPANAPTQLTPSCSTQQNLTLNKLITTNSTKVFLYTPCGVSIQNSSGSTFDGQIYSGSGSYSSGLQIKRAVMTIPGVVIPGSTVPASGTSSAVITSRYDVG